MKKRLLFITLGVGMLAIASCSGTNEPYNKILTPTGAPALSLVQLTDKYSVTSGAAKTIKPEFTKDDYGAVVFDFYNGLNAIANSEGKSHFKLWRIITGGNLYVVGLGEDKSEPVEGSKVVSFGANLLPDLVFKKIYEDVDYSIEYVTDNQLLAGVIETGTYNSQDVDYVVAPEPVLTSGLTKRKAAGLPYHDPISLATKWGAVIPQAGLFINHDYYYTKYTSFFHDFYRDFDNNVKTLTTVDEETGEYPTSEVVSYMNSHWSTPAEQAAMWGFNSTIIGKVHKYNGLALVNDGSWDNVTLQDFYDRLGKAAEYEVAKDYIVDPSILIG